MNYGIGIDTGGTYTDAVLYCFDTRTVVARAKALTDSGNLSHSIDEALSGLPETCFPKVGSVAISTTLATNACVEGKGGRARLVLVGVSEAMYRKLDAEKQYGLREGDVLCVDSYSSFDGKTVEPVDWDAVINGHSGFFGEAEALSVAAMNAVRNGAVHEFGARDALSARYPVPFVMANALAGELNVFERGATALLNARLLPLIHEFMGSVQAQLDRRGIACRYMTVRSDGSLMGPELAVTRPVDTILSGPAASVVGARALADCERGLVVDIGGTTTDIAVIRDGEPVMTNQIRIGGWRTQIRGVSIDTFALGGDTRLFIRRSALTLDTRRVKPLCALAAECPGVVDALQALVDSKRQHSLPIHEFLQLVRPDADASRFTAAENALIDKLRGGPLMLGGGEIDLYGTDSERLEREGVVLRCGLTPTDIMHVTGEFRAFDARASVLGVRFFLRNLPDYSDREEDVEPFCREALEMLERRLFQHIAGTLLRASYPKLFPDGALDSQFSRYIDSLWDSADCPDGLCSLRLLPQGRLIGIGAPTHVFLPEVARRLGMDWVVPECAEVANAVGAIVAGVSLRVVVRIRPDVEGGYAVHGPGLNERFEEYEEALAAARAAAEDIAREQARSSGARGDYAVHLEIVQHTSHTRSRAAVDLGTDVIASVAEPDSNR